MCQHQMTQRQPGVMTILWHYTGYTSSTATSHFEYTVVFVWAKKHDKQVQPTPIRHSYSDCDEIELDVDHLAIVSTNGTLE